MKKLEKLSKVLKQCLKMDANIPLFNFTGYKKRAGRGQLFFIGSLSTSVGETITH
ncbi:hypothetical protein ABZG88_001989 [Staphylococcus pseudintermedius]|nr:hypothetical protein [Staphylococcus pseudintermedius]HBJ9570871.1 hypothetical protein [Staphylococcus pseudintermedius]